MSVTNALTERLHDSRTVANIDTDGSGQVQITMGELRHIDHVADVTASAIGGYVVNPISVSGNTVTLEVFETAGSNGEMAEVTSGTDVTDVHVRAEGY